MNCDKYFTRKIGDQCFVTLWSPVKNHLNPKSKKGFAKNPEALAKLLALSERDFFKLNLPEDMTKALMKSQVEFAEKFNKSS